MINADVLFLILVPVTGWFARELWKIRTNDMRHLDARLDKIESILVDHLTWHAAHHPK